MLGRGELELVAPDQAFATSVIEMAATHVASAQRNAELDPLLAYAALHDAIRKSFSAVLQAQGLRATSKGGHIAVQDAIDAQFGNVMAKQLRSANRIRVRRHECEYPGPTTRVDADEVLADLPIAREISTMCRDAIAQVGPFAAR